MLGITGPGSGTEDDYAAEEHFDSEVEWHESGKCEPVVEAVVWATDDFGRTASDLAANACRVAEFLDTLGPDVPVPTHIEPGYGKRGQVSWLLFSDTDLDRQRAIAAAVVRGVGGKWDKRPGELFAFKHVLPSGLELDVTVSRPAVCERVVTGTREVVKTVPAPDAPMVEVTEVVEDVEWVCEPLLAEATR
jgi:hypothetical protein